MINHQLYLLKTNNFLTNYKKTRSLSELERLGPIDRTRDTWVR